MNKKNKIPFLILAILTFVTILFYWTNLRPGFIRKNCYETAMKSEVGDLLKAINPNAKPSKTEQNNIYRSCLVNNGLKAESLFINLK